MYEPGSPPLGLARPDVPGLELCLQYSRRTGAPAARGIPLGLGSGAGRFDGTLRDFVDRLAKRFRSKVEIVNLLEVHPEIGT